MTLIVDVRKCYKQNPSKSVLASWLWAKNVLATIRVLAIMFAHVHLPSLK
jgi:hypothetical protein